MRVPENSKASEVIQRAQHAEHVSVESVVNVDKLLQSETAFKEKALSPQEPHTIIQLSTLYYN
jgi:hypothetical protein